MPNTGDIGLFIERSEDNAARVGKVLRDFGFGRTGFQAKGFLEWVVFGAGHRVHFVVEVLALWSFVGGTLCWVG